MKAGRELDAMWEQLVEKVMGWVPINTEYRTVYKEDRQFFPEEFNPFEEIADAWLVVEKLKELNFSLENRCFYDHWYCVFDNEFSATAETAPLAVCLSALKAIGIEVSTIEK